MGSILPRERCLRGFVHLAYDYRHSTSTSCERRAQGPGTDSGEGYFSVQAKQFRVGDKRLMPLPAVAPLMRRNGRAVAQLFNAR
jgi:hypothetical protein